MLIDPTFSREFQFSPAMARVSGAGRRFAPQGGDGNQRHWQKKLSDRWYDQLLLSTPGPRMELQRNAEFLRALGAVDFKARLPEYRAKTAGRITDNKPYYILFPGASWDKKQWPIENFAALATRIHQATGSARACSVAVPVRAICRGKYSRRPMPPWKTESVEPHWMSLPVSLLRPGSW